MFRKTYSGWFKAKVFFYIAFNKDGVSDNLKKKVVALDIGHGPNAKQVCHCCSEEIACMQAGWMVELLTLEM